LKKGSGHRSGHHLKKPQRRSLVPGNSPATMAPPAPHQLTGNVGFGQDQPLTPGAHQPNPASMTIILESAVTATEHRCEALTISDIPTPYRCTTSATADRQGRAVCPAHSRTLRVRWFDADD
jgi:hypothetical protein